MQLPEQLVPLRPADLLSWKLVLTDRSTVSCTPGWFVNAHQQTLAGSPAEGWFVRQYVSAKGHSSVPSRTRYFSSAIISTPGTERPEPALEHDFIMGPPRICNGAHGGQ